MHPGDVTSQFRAKRTFGNDSEYIMARVSGLEKKDAVASAVVLRPDAQNVRERFTPAKIQMRLPGLVWGGIAMEAGLGRKRLVPLCCIQLGKVRAASRVGCPF